MGSFVADLPSVKVIKNELRDKFLHPNWPHIVLGKFLLGVEVMAHVVVPHALGVRPFLAEPAFECLIPAQDGLFRMG